MRIDYDHMYHGAALIQIAEHKSFTAINSVRRSDGTLIRSAYRVNDNIAVYVKHAASPRRVGSEEFQFTFNISQLKVIRHLAEIHPKTYIVLVCVKARDICAITVDQLYKLMKTKLNLAGNNPDQYLLLVTARAGSSFRVRIPGYDDIQSVTISRNAFPDVIFG